MVQNDLKPVLSWPGSFITKKILTVSSKLVGSSFFFKGGGGRGGGGGGGGECRGKK